MFSQHAETENRLDIYCIVEKLDILMKRTKRQDKLRHLSAFMKKLYISLL